MNPAEAILAPVILRDPSVHGSIEARISPYGATLTHLLVPSKKEEKSGIMVDVVLGFDDPRSYMPEANKGNRYFGAIVGRVANR